MVDIKNRFIAHTKGNITDEDIDTLYTVYLLKYAFVDVDDLLDTEIMSKEEFIKHI